MLSTTPKSPYEKGYSFFIGCSIRIVAYFILLLDLAEYLIEP